MHVSFSHEWWTFMLFFLGSVLTTDCFPIHQGLRVSLPYRLASDKWVLRLLVKWEIKKGSDGGFLSDLVIVFWNMKHFSNRALAPVMGVNGGPHFPLLRFKFPPPSPGWPCRFLPSPSSMSVTSLEAELQARIRETHPELRRVYFNKGL